MIIRRIDFKNIRSYSEATIDFPLGKTLFEGDVGSGKSSILMAIEFAFFGLGSETGGSLLKIGEKEGSVALVFDVDGQEYEIVRGLARKGPRVQQTEGRIRTQDEELDLSPTELKEKILEILKFNEAPDPKAQSRIYRYAVYTPQEDMKSILVMAPEDRLQILRRAFGIEDYRVAVGNSESIAREVKGRIRDLRSAASEVDELRARKETEEQDLAGLKERAARMSGEEGRASRDLATLKDERERLRGDEIRLAALSKDVASHERSVRRLKEEQEEVRDEREQAEARLRKSETSVEGPRQAPGGRSRAELEEDAEELEERSKRLAILKDRADQKLVEYQSIIKEGRCPVCERPVEAHEFAEKERSKAAETAHLQGEAEECQAKLEQARKALEERRDYDSATERFALEEEALEEGRKRLEKAKDREKRLSEELEEAEDSLGEARKEQESLSGSSARLKKLEESISDGEEEVRRIGKELADTTARAEEKEKTLSEDLRRLERAESAAEKAGNLAEYQIWLEDYFAPTVGAIEKEVMASVNQEFDSSFKRWFSMLIGDPQKEVRVDDNFTPIVAQDGYEQESEYLSGGERTSVALAYRLALNTLVQRVSTGMKSNILILDEPTDGFSKEQLGSVREILDEVGCPQIIIVSHEKELESFADQIYRVTKSHGESRVEGSPL